MKIIKPIFIIGTAGSGKTALIRLFTRHKDTAYFEHYVGKYFNSRWKFHFLPILHKYRKIRYNIDRPIPANVDFPTGIEYVDETEVTKETGEFYYDPIKTTLKLFNAKRFVNDSAKHCLRIRWLNELFPDAYYVIICRNPKDVISTIRKRINNNKHILLFKEKFGTNLSNIEISIKNYQYYKNHLLNDLPLVTDRTIEIKYEDLVKDSRNELKRLYYFTELEWYDELEKDIPKHLDHKNHEEWKILSSSEQELLTKLSNT